MSDGLDDDGTIQLGPCCICEGRPATVIVTLSQRAAIPGHGWGCAQCGLPSDGATAVLCEPCFALYSDNAALLTHCCRGYPASDGRMAIADLSPEVFDHDLSRHPEMSDGPEPMRLELTATRDIVPVTLKGQRVIGGVDEVIVAARRWIGRTGRGTPVIAYIVGVVPQELGADVDSEFRDLVGMGPETAART